MKWIKAALVGALGSLVMFLLMMVGIEVTGIAPFNMPPSAAFLQKLGLNAGPLPLVVHFGYGATWAMVLIALYGAKANLWNGLKLSLALWLFTMAVYSPIIGWGFFGFGGTGQELSADAPLYLGSSMKYVVATLVLHLIYGSIIGGLTPAWVDLAPSERSAA